MSWFGNYLRKINIIHRYLQYIFMLGHMPYDPSSTAIHFKICQSDDLETVSHFLNVLPNTIKEKFAPHDFDRLSLHKLLIDNSKYHAFLAYEQHKLIAYQVVKTGWLDYEWPRLSSYPIKWSYFQTATFAPVIDPAYQNKGISKALFSYLKKHLKKWGIQAVVLWGGVQSSNQAALHFYKNLEFSELGHFEYHGDNIDMMLKI